MKTTVSIFRNAHDCTNNGLSSKVDNAWAVNPAQIDGCIQDVLENIYEERGDFFVVCPNVLGKGVHLKPYSIYSSGIHSMFGGNFAYTSCSSFQRVTSANAPVKIHDRVER